MPILRVAASSILLKGGCPECGHDMSKHMTVIGGGHACLQGECRDALDAGFMRRKGDKTPPKKRMSECWCEREHTQSCATCGHAYEHHEEFRQAENERRARGRGPYSRYYKQQAAEKHPPYCVSCTTEDMHAKAPNPFGGRTNHPFTPMDHLPADIRDTDLGKGRRYPEERCKECGHRYRSHAEVEGSTERGRCLYPDCGCPRATRVPEQLPEDIRDMEKGRKTVYGGLAEFVAKRDGIDYRAHRLAHRATWIPKLGGWDVRCKCGWESRTGGAIRPRVKEYHDEHVYEALPRADDVKKSDGWQDIIAERKAEMRAWGELGPHDHGMYPVHEHYSINSKGPIPKGRRGRPIGLSRADDHIHAHDQQGTALPGATPKGRRPFVPNRLPAEIRDAKSLFVIEESPIVDVTARSLFELVVDEPRMMKDGIEKSGPGMMKLKPGEKGWMTIRGEGPMSGRPIRAEMGRGMKLHPPTERRKVNLGPEIGMREYTPEESKGIRALPHEKAHADDLLKQYRESTPDQRKRGHNWYPRASQIVDRYAGQHEMPTGKKVGYSRSQISGALAALSPRQNWGENVFMLDRVVRAHQHGTEFKRVRGLGFRGNGQKAWRILGGASPSEVLGEKKRTGQKVRAFHHALENFDGKEHTDHSKCDQPTVIDALMDRALHGTKKPNHRPTAIDGKVYREHSNAVRVAAMRAGVEPWALQATVWTKMNDEGGGAPRAHVAAEGQPHMLKLAGVWPGSTKRRKLMLKSQSVWRAE